MSVSRWVLNFKGLLLWHIFHFFTNVTGIFILITKTENMENVVVLSTIENKGKDIAKAPFWKEAYHKDEVTKEML